MKKPISKSKYNQTISLISHLILTQPVAVRKLLARYGIVFLPTPTPRQLIDQTVELLAEGNPSFNNSLSKLLMVHLQHKGDELLAIKPKTFNTYDNEDEFLGGLVGGLAKGLIGGVSGLLKKKKNKSSGSNTNSSSEKLKEDMALKLKQMELEQKRRMEEQRRKSEEERRRREEEDRRRKQAANRNTLLIGGGIAIAVVVAVLAVALKSKN